LRSIASISIILASRGAPGRELANTLPPVSHSLKRTQTRRRTPMSIDSATEANRTSENAHHDFDHVVDRRNSNSMKWQAGAALLTPRAVGGRSAADVGRRHRLRCPEG